MQRIQLKTWPSYAQNSSPIISSRLTQRSLLHLMHKCFWRWRQLEAPPRMLVPYYLVLLSTQITCGWNEIEVAERSRTKQWVFLESFSVSLWSQISLIFRLWLFEIQTYATSDVPSTSHSNALLASTSRWRSSNSLVAGVFLLKL